ncbi:YrhK family protein [Cryobacterium tepidiphilum]|uniref:YrhK domain-containing protein n=1 Tax=Cryobacterium tepidiphilum TaxID=2486026 RepID=A0A3M8LFD5_9MICO|nr:YrhK family protein [Cryobacterium tepidiphilum]RNE64035.1 hypothetical protein EEJ31_05585 [Cryobacterium tepidiphilum]
MPDSKLTIDTGHHVLVVKNRYLLLARINDILTGLWFVAGSFLFLSDSTKLLGTIFFIIGSIELLIRPVIQIVRDVHLKRIDPSGQHHD